MLHRFNLMFQPHVSKRWELFFGFFSLQKVQLLLRLMGQFEPLHRKKKCWWVHMDGFFGTLIIPNSDPLLTYRIKNDMTTASFKSYRNPPFVGVWSSSPGCLILLTWKTAQKKKSSDNSNSRLAFFQHDSTVPFWKQFHAFTCWLWVLGLVHGLPKDHDKNPWVKFFTFGPWFSWCWWFLSLKKKTKNNQPHIHLMYWVFIGYILLKGSNRVLNSLGPSIPRVFPPFSLLVVAPPTSQPRHVLSFTHAWRGGPGSSKKYSVFLFSF